MEEQTPIRAEIDKLRASEAYTNSFHPSHEAAMRTIAELYSREYPDAEPEEVEGLKTETNKVQAEALKVDDPEAAKTQEALAPLKAEWGHNYETNLKSAQGLVDHLSREMGLEVVELFDEIGSDAAIIRACFEWSQGRDGGEVSPEEAKRLIGLISKSRVYQSGISQTSEVLRNVMAVLYEAAHQQEN